MTAPSTDPRGLKRLCTECGIRFYDMNKRPIICPNCGAEYAGFDKTKSRPAVVDEKPTNENTKSTEEEEIDGDDDPWPVATLRRSTWMMPPRWKITTTPMMMRPWI